jgi:hypothetical protein
MPGPPCDADVWIAIAIATIAHVAAARATVGELGGDRRRRGLRGHASQRGAVRRFRSTHRVGAGPRPAGCEG